MDDGLELVKAEITERIDEEGGAPTDFLAEKSDARAGVVVGFDDDVFELVAEELLDSGLVLFGNFGVVGENADSMEVAG